MSEEMQRVPIQWELLGAVSCFIAAVVFLAFGFVLTTRLLLDEHVHPLLHGIGIILLITGIPLIILGGHCMDLREKKLQKNKALHIVVAALLLLGATSAAHAQQTIFNVPTTDVLDKGKVYVELDASLKPAEDAEVKKFSSFVPRVVIGYAAYSIGNQNVSGGNHFFLLEVDYNLN
jgi:hypothetical protein